MKFNSLQRPVTDLRKKDEDLVLLANFCRILTDKQRDIVTPWALDGAKNVSKKVRKRGEEI